MAAQKFYDNQKSAIEAATSGDPYVICIIQHDSSQTGIDRANGFKDKIDELAATQKEAGTFESYIEVKTNNSGEYKAALQASQTRANAADAVFMCNEGVVNECYPEVTDNKDKYANIVFCGFDAGTNQIDWIKGKVAGGQTHRVGRTGFLPDRLPGGRAGSLRRREKDGDKGSRYRRYLV